MPLSLSASGEGLLEQAWPIAPAILAAQWHLAGVGSCRQTELWLLLSGRSLWCEKSAHQDHAEQLAGHWVRLTAAGSSTC